MNDELGRWSEEWRRSGALPAGLAVRVRHDRLHGTLGLAAGWLSVACMAWLCLDLLAGEECAANRAALWFGALLPPLLMLWHTRREAALRRADRTASADCLAEWRRRLNGDIELGRTWWPLALVVGFVLAWTPWKLSEAHDLFAARPGLAAACVAGLVAIVAGVAVAQVVGRRRDERRAQALEQLARECEGE